MTPIDFEALAAPFEPTDLDWRVGSKTKKGDKATLLVYLTSRAVQARLDTVVGPDRWRNAFTPVYEGAKVIGHLCSIDIEVEPGKWVAKVDGSDPTDIESFKGGLSGAMKRAAVLWGIGRYLYDVDSKWHTIREGYGPDDVSVYCPIGDNKPGHILIPALAARHLPKPKASKGKKGAIDTTPTPGDQALADDVARDLEARRAEADKARKADHDPSWEKDGGDFCGAVKGKLNLDTDLAMDLAATVDPWRKRPTSMTRDERVAYYRWLSTDVGRNTYAEYRHERAEMDARGAA